ncbi:unnamed protein product, partial [Meganyctiphanes norvegica]
IWQLVFCRSGQENTMWYLLFTVFVTYAMLPLPLRWGLAGGVVSTLVHLAATTATNQVWCMGVTVALVANASLYVAVNAGGLYTKYLTDRTQRKAFLETRRAMEMRTRTQ